MARFMPGVLAAVMAVALPACSLGEPPMTTLQPKSDLARWIYDLLLRVTVWDALVFVVVLVATILAVFVFSTRVGEAGPPSSVASDLGLEAVWTIVPALIILMISIPTVRLIFRTQPVSVPKNALRIEVTAHQWWWEFRYPGAHFTTANEMHIPIGRPIRLSLKSADVIHSFWVPQLGGKRDVVPGQTNQLSFVAEVHGEYLGQCAEFCGLSHANMRFRVFVDSPRGFARWEAAQQASARAPAKGDAMAAAGEEIFADSPCTTCHTLGDAAQGHLGPDLTHFGSRTTLAAGLMKNTPENLARWLVDPKAVKPGARMPSLGLRGRNLAGLVTYLEGLK